MRSIANEIMKKKLLTLLLIALTMGGVSTVSAQVTIGSNNEPNKNALLDLNEGKGTNNNQSEKGLLLSRVALVDASLATPMTDHVAGMMIYNTAKSPTDGSVDAKNYVSPGFYYNNGTRWEKLHLGTDNWFYMPSIVIDVATSGTFTRDLYIEYQKQFSDRVADANNTALIKSTDAPSPFTKILTANELYYYVIGYDPAVFSELSITADGKLSYTVNADNVTDATFMNIVFVEK